MVIVNLDRPRSMKYGMTGVSFIEKKLGMPIGKVDFENMTMECMAIFIQAAVIHEDKEFGLKTAEEVMEIIDKNDNMEEVMKAAKEAMKEMRAKKQGKN